MDEESRPEIEFIDSPENHEQEIVTWEFDPGRDADYELHEDGTLEIHVSRKALEKNRGFELSLPEGAERLRVVRYDK